MSKARSKPTARQLEEVKALQAMPDDKIDYSDIPATQPEEWRNAVVGKFYKPIKQQLTVRIDADVIAWLKTKGKGYQTRINQLLREAMGKEAGNH